MDVILERKLKVCSSSKKSENTEFADLKFSDSVFSVIILNNQTSSFLFSNTAKNTIIKLILFTKYSRQNTEF